MREYEEQATPLFVRLESSRVHDRQRLDLLDLAIGTPMRDEALSERQRILTARADVQLQILGVNDAYAAKVCTTLDAPRSKAFWLTYCLAAYPPVCPDELDPRPLLAEIAGKAHLTEEQRIVLQELTARFERSYSGVTETMKQRFIGFRYTYASENTTRGFDDYSAEMRRLRAARWEINRQFVADARALAESGLAASEIQASCEKYNMLAEHMVRRSENDHYPGR